MLLIYSSCDIYRTKLPAKFTKSFLRVQCFYQKKKTKYSGKCKISLHRLFFLPVICLIFIYSRGSLAVNLQKTLKLHRFKNHKEQTHII
jgi:hypothetical protein